MSDDPDRYANSGVTVPEADGPLFRQSTIAEADFQGARARFTTEGTGLSYLRWTNASRCSPNRELCPGTTYLANADYQHAAYDVTQDVAGNVGLTRAT